MQRHVEVEAVAEDDDSERHDEGALATDMFAGANNLEEGPGSGCLEHTAVGFGSGVRL